MNAPRRLWYVKQSDEPVGPFPEAALIQDLLLGRLTRDTPVSEDRASWVSLGSVADAAKPRDAHAMPAPDSASWEEERRRALLRWADQRRGADRGGSVAEQGSGQRQERRETPSAAIRSAARNSPSVERIGRAWAWRLGLVLIALALGIALLAVLYGPSNPIDVRIR